MWQPLTGRTAVVTGGSRGIGAATARALAKAGARVALMARTRTELDSLAAEIQGIAVQCDLLDRASMDAGVRRAESEIGGAPDILVNNAGVFRTAAAGAMEPATIAESVGLNLVVPLLLVNAFLPAMRKRGSGHIVTIGSIADRKIFEGNSVYSATKFGARAMHEVMRAELKGSGIRATLVSPGSTDTSLWDDAGEGEFPPRSEMLTGESVADAILYAVTRPPDTNVDELRLTRS
ncbi:MAG: SDR family NAD(P)-dependent oxidoreductase [Gemmatimonadota bacterium]|nr:SDR family NAD(P)-dependent oxidoreductase [Gemmatimonadaceae bacterium]MDQ3516479.1 SDR family NAD(P)-dependent oxidoreductase [Gemmatimonadota bacterium]